MSKAWRRAFAIAERKGMRPIVVIGGRVVRFSASEVKPLTIKRFYLEAIEGFDLRLTRGGEVWHYRAERGAEGYICTIAVRRSGRMVYTFPAAELIGVKPAPHAIMDASRGM